MKLKPPADATDFLEVIYRASEGIIQAQIRRGEFDFNSITLNKNTATKERALFLESAL